MDVFGLIGYPLTHSFSKGYFTEKFKRENIQGKIYELFELKDIAEFPALIAAQPSLKGLNVTIPYKEAVIKYLDDLDTPAKKIGAVNVIKINSGKLVGYNSDYHGFKASLEKFIPANYKGMQALVLGSGGAAKAVKAALEDMQIPYKIVVRKEEKDTIHYKDVDASLINSYHLIINTTPLGMYPKTDMSPAIPYEALTANHFLFDLVYNPEETLFLKKGKEMGARTKNGLEMLHLQAEKAWQIWNDL